MLITEDIVLYCIVLYCIFLTIDQKERRINEVTPKVWTKKLLGSLHN